MLWTNGRNVELIMTQAASEPEIINLGIGQPQNSILPNLNELFGSFSKDYFNSLSTNALAYGYEHGSVEFRSSLEQFLNLVSLCSQSVM